MDNFVSRPSNYSVTRGATHLILKLKAAISLEKCVAPVPLLVPSDDEVMTLKGMLIMMNLNMLTPRPLMKRMLVMLALMLGLIGCADSANYAIFRESLEPLRGQVDVGMEQDDLLTLLEAEYPEVELYEYPYDDEIGSEFDLEGKEVDGDIYQLTMSGDPADRGVTSICFFKVLFVGDGGTGQRAIQVTDVSCPA